MTLPCSGSAATI